jgi:hypothetical protein
MGTFHGRARAAGKALSEMLGCTLPEMLGCTLSERHRDAALFLGPIQGQGA